MKVKLYKPFDWYRGGTIYIISDTHFDDPESKKMNELWPTPQEMVNSINQFVGKKDTLIHLGDVGDIEWVKRLKGYKVLLLGNHDKGASNYIKKYSVHRDNGDIISDNILTLEEAEETVKEYELDHCDRNIAHIKNNGLFDEVYEGPLFINEKILLSHEPVSLPFGINIHGHVHEGLRHEYWANDRVMINVCSDVRDFKPVRLDDVISGFSVKDLHRQTINRAVKRKNV